MASNPVRKKRSIFKVKISVKEFGSIYEVGQYNDKTAIKSINNSLIDLEFESDNLDSIRERVAGHLGLIAEIDVESQDDNN